MEKNNRTKYLFKNIAVFALGNLATKIISFFLIPLYTNVLSTPEYGVVDLVATVATIAIPIFTLNIMESVMRFNLDKNATHNKITKIGIVLLLGTAMLGLLIIPVCSFFKDLSELRVLVYLYCIFQAVSQVFLCDLRGKELLVQYSVGNIINTLLISAFNIVFLLVFKLGVKGFLLAYILANFFVSIYAFFVGKSYKAIFERIDKKLMIDMLKYSIILIPTSFMWWIINSSDHLMVTSMVGLAANGIYAVSYKLPTLISTFTGIFNQAWSYSAIKEDSSKDIEFYTNFVFKSLIGVIMLVGLGMMTFIKPFLKFYVASNYYEAWKYTPFLIIGFVYMTLGTFMSTTYTVHKDSKGFLISGAVGAFLNIILNFILIPFIDVYGAALATCISYMSVFVFRAIHTRKYIHYRVLTRELIIGSLTLVLSGVLMFVDSMYARLMQLFILIIVLVLFKNIWLVFLKKMFGQMYSRIIKGENHDNSL